MGHILHDWDLRARSDAACARPTTRCPAGGALIVFEAIIDDDRRENAFGLLMSLNMLIETPGGFDYTGADCHAWMREAGFRETRVEHLRGPDSMVVGNQVTRRRRGPSRQRGCTGRPRLRRRAREVRSGHSSPGVPESSIRARQ